MTLLLNSYCDIQSFKDYFADNGVIDTPDDRVIMAVLNGVSRFIDNRTTRKFYPRIDTRYYSTPPVTEFRNGRMIRLNDDLLTASIVTNGDGSTVSASSYNLESLNSTPHWGLTLKQSSALSWMSSTSGDNEYNISITGVWGCHDDYSAAHISRGALSAAINDTVTSIGTTTSTGVNFANGMILKIDSEWLACDAVSTDTLTVRRAINGSTATNHLINAPIAVYYPMQDIVEACKMIALNVYRRFGNRSGASGDVTITGAGVVVTPKDLTGVARETLENWTPIMTYSEN